MEKLPLEMKMNILARLPFKSIARCKSLSTHWYNLLSDPSFLSFQLENHFKNPNLDVIFVHKEEHSLSYLETTELDTVPENSTVSPFKVFDLNFMYESSPKVEDDAFPLILGDYNGFFCISMTKMMENFYYFPTKSIWVVNPITEEHFKIPDHNVLVPDIPDEFKGRCLFCSYDRYFRFFSAFGFEKSRNEFKFVLITFSAYDFDRKLFKNELRVYTLGSNNWRKKVGVVPKELLDSKAFAMFVNGCLHWLTIDVNSPDKKPTILSFNLQREEFGFVSTPKIEHPYRNYRLGVFEESLSFISNSNNCVEIRIMQTYNSQESWFKQFSISRGLLHTYWNTCPQVDVIKLCKNGELLLLWNARFIVAYDVVTERFRYVKAKGVDGEAKQFTQGLPFVGSLLPLNSDSRIRSLKNSESKREEKKRKRSPT